jgi:hypothetical protein
MSNQAIRNMKTLSRCQQRHDAAQPDYVFEKEAERTEEEEPDYSSQYDAKREARGLDCWA